MLEVTPTTPRAGLRRNARRRAGARAAALWLACGFALGTARAQSPFDLAREAPAPAAADAPAAAAPATGAIAPTAPAVADAPASPFDLRRGGGPAAASPPAAVGGEPAAAPSPPTARSRFDTLLCAGLLILIAVTFVAQGGVLRRMWQAAFNANLLARLQREQRKGGAYWWASLGAVVLGAFAYVSARELWPGLVPEGWRVLDAFVLAALGLTAARLLALAVLGWAFPLGKPLGAYRELVLVWAGVLGVALFPALVLACFAPPAVARAACYAGVAAAGVAYLWRGLRAVAAAGRYATGHPGHFLLYFCALEISPPAIGFAWLAG